MRPYSEPARIEQRFNRALTVMAAIGRMSIGEVHSETHARAILGLASDAPLSTWRGAFQREVKAAHPDHGGDPERLRLVIEAYRILKLTDPKARRAAAPSFKSASRPTPAPPPPRARPSAKPAPDAKVEDDADDVADLSGAGDRPSFPISIVEAFLGGDKTIAIKNHGKLRVRLPAGLQTGDVVRFGANGQHYLTITVRPHPGAELRGADLWLQVSVSAEFLKEGGRMEVDTPFGARKFWVSRTSAARGVFRAPGEGLPARGDRLRGNLYLTFVLDESLNASPSRSLLKRFAAAWASA